MKVASVSSINIAGHEIECLLLDDGKTIGFSLTQIAKVGGFHLNNTSRVLSGKRATKLLPQGFHTSHLPTYAYGKTRVKFISLELFEICLRLLDRLGYESATNIVDDLIGLSLQQLANDAFNIKFEKEERQAWLKARQEGKATRRTLTDAIHDYLESHQVSEDYRKWIYARVTNDIYKGLFGYTAKQMRSHRKIAEHNLLRDNLSNDEIKKIDQCEAFVMRRIDLGHEPLRSVQDVFNFAVFSR